MDHARLRRVAWPSSAPVPAGCHPPILVLYSHRVSLSTVAEPNGTARGSTGRARSSTGRWPKPRPRPCPLCCSTAARLPSTSSVSTMASIRSRETRYATVSLVPANRQGASLLHLLEDPRVALRLADGVRSLHGGSTYGRGRRRSSSRLHIGQGAAGLNVCGVVAGAGGGAGAGPGAGGCTTGRTGG